MKKEKGITLVALVITIIIMLILVGVTVATVIDGGLLDKASKSAFLTKWATMDEQFKMFVAQGVDGEHTITNSEAEEFLKKYLPKNVSVDDLAFNVKTGKLTYKGTNAEYKEWVESTLENQTSEEIIDPNALINYANPGDKVNYTVDGYTGEWRVLYNDGKNISIISMGSVEEIELEGKDDYNNGVEILNNRAEAYMNVFAKSARCVGSNPNGTDTTKMAWEDNTNYSFIETHASDLRAGNLNYNEEYDTDIEGFPNQIEDYAKMVEIDINNINENYWLASRLFIAASEGVTLNMGSVYSGGDFNINYLYIVYSDGYPESNSLESGVRPVITLKSSVLMAGGNGTDGWDIELK